ncbi:hypothetical protein D3C86_1769810 [compost metagenome]
MQIQVEVFSSLFVFLSEEVKLGEIFVSRSEVSVRLNCFLVVLQCKVIVLTTQVNRTNGVVSNRIIWFCSKSVFVSGYRITSLVT